MLSFLHKPYLNTSTIYYYAFTFPYTYTDCQAQLKSYDELYGKSEAEIDYIFRRLNADVNSNTSDYRDATAPELDSPQPLMNGKYENVLFSNK